MVGRRPIPDGLVGGNPDPPQHSSVPELQTRLPQPPAGQEVSPEFRRGHSAGCPLIMPTRVTFRRSRNGRSLQGPLALVPEPRAALFAGHWCLPLVVIQGSSGGPPSPEVSVACSQVPYQASWEVRQETGGPCCQHPPPDSGSPGRSEWGPRAWDHLGLPSRVPPWRRRGSRCGAVACMARPTVSVVCARSPALPQPHSQAGPRGHADPVLGLCPAVSILSLHPFSARALVPGRSASLLLGAVAFYMRRKYSWTYRARLPVTASLRGGRQPGSGPRKLSSALPGLRGQGRRKHTCDPSPGQGTVSASEH